MNPHKVMIRASEILVQRGLKPELSPQARAVIEAICEETPTGRMKKPTIEEVKLHGAKIGLPDGECDRFFSYYEANGWRVGKSPMRLWTAAMANWKRTWQEHQSGHVNGNVQSILKQKALERVEKRITEIRGQFPLPTGHKLLADLNELKIERASLMNSLGLKC